MKRCPKCGAELDDQVRFCYQCGEMLGAGAVQTSGPEVDEDDDEDNMQTIIIGGSTEEEEAPALQPAAGMQPPAGVQPPAGAQPPAGVRPAAGAQPAGGPQPPRPETPTVKPGSQEFQSAVFCPNCGHRNVGGELFCEECGSRLDGSDIAAAAGGAAGTAGGAWQNTAGALAEGPKKGPGKGLIVKIIAGVAAAAIVAAVGFLVVPKVLSGIGGGGKSSAGKTLTRAVYYTEDGLFFADLKKKKNQSKLVTEDLTRKDSSYHLPSGKCITDDGKYLYYFEDVDGGDGDLKRIKVSDIGKKNKTGEDVASNVSSISMLESGNILYTKSGKLNLIQGGNLKKIEKLFDADDCSYILDEDGKAVVWAEPKKNKEKWDLHFQTFGKKPAVLKEGIKGTRIGLVSINDSLSSFYVAVRKDNDTYTLLKYTSDGKETEIENKADGVLAYFDDGIYYWKTDKNGNHEIYYWNGKSSEKVMELTLGNSSYSKEGGALLVIDDGDYQKDDRTWHILQDGKEILKGDCAREDFEEFGSDFLYDKAGKRYLVTGRETGERWKTLYELKDGKSGMGEVAKDVCRIVRIEDDVLWIGNADDDGLGELFRNGKKIADDVKSILASKYYNGIFCYNEDQDLSVVKGGKTSDVCREVERVIIGNENSVLVLYDYDKGEGTLGYYNGKDVIKIGDDVKGMAR